MHHGVDVVSRFVDTASISRALEPWLPDPAQRAFVLRCVLEEGPKHHRGSNFVLLSLLIRLSERVGATQPTEGPQRPFKMRLPPHLDAELDEKEWPIGLPQRPLDLLAPGDARTAEAMASCLTDGPPQHAVANVLMVHLLSSMLAKLGA